MKKKNPVALTDTERQQLQALIAAGTAPARKLTHTQVLRKADQAPGGPAWVDDPLAEANLCVVSPHSMHHAAPLSILGGDERLLGVAAMLAVSCSVIRAA